MTRFCSICGKPWDQDSGPSYFTLKTSPDGMQERIFVCGSCKPNVNTGENSFTRVYLPGHSREQRPFWHNDTPLQASQALDPSSMPLSDYPLIEDFEVVVLWWIEQQLGKEEWHASAQLVSSSRGYLTYLLGVDLSRSDFILPHGGFDKPYALYAEWETLYTLIAEDDEFVYILTDNEVFMLDDRRNRISLYHAWFRAEKSRYYSQWKQAIYLARFLSAAQKRESKPTS